MPAGININRRVNYHYPMAKKKSKADEEERRPVKIEELEQKL